MHDRERVVRVWDIEQGKRVSEWKLPFTGRGWDKNWKGLAVALFLGTFWNARFTFPDE